MDEKFSTGPLGKVPKEELGEGPRPLAGFLDRIGPPSDKLSNAWAQAAGPKLAKGSKVSLRKGVFKVTVESPALAQKLSMDRQALLEGLKGQEATSKVQKVEIKVGAVSSLRGKSGGSVAEQKFLGNRHGRRQVVTLESRKTPCPHLSAVVDGLVRDVGEGELRDVMHTYLLAALARIDEG